MERITVCSQSGVMKDSITELKSRITIVLNHSDTNTTSTLHLTKALEEVKFLDGLLHLVDPQPIER